jgi:hypothetical protein
MIDRLQARDEWKFTGVLRQADRTLTIAWWTLLILRGVLPALFAIAMGGLVQQAGSLAAPLGLVGIVFVLLQVLSPIHQAVGANLGSRTAASGYYAESAVWHDRNTDEVRAAQRHVDYGYKLAVEPHPGCGLSLTEWRPLNARAAGREPAFLKAPQWGVLWVEESETGLKPRGTSMRLERCYE